MGLLQNQDTSRQLRSTSFGGEARLRELSQQFNTALDRCASVAGVAEVHRVRTGSRRLQATVESILRRDVAGEKSLERAGTAWLRQMKKLRRAAGPVRDLDVHRKLLERTAADGNSVDSGPAYEQSAAAPGADSFAEEIRSLDLWLGDRRRDRADALVRQIRKRREKLADREAAFFAASEECGNRRLGRTVSAAGPALEDFARATETLPSLNTENLHQFRKLAKKARYIAESGGPDAAEVARALKRIQDAIGEWHDWLGLAGEAEIALGGRVPQLTARLEGNLDRSLARALRATSVARAHLLVEWSLKNGAGPYVAAVEKRPPSRAVRPARKSASGSGAA